MPSDRFNHRPPVVGCVRRRVGWMHASLPQQNALIVTSISPIRVFDPAHRPTARCAWRDHCAADMIRHRSDSDFIGFVLRGLSCLSPNVNAFAQRFTSIFSRLPAAISFADGQDKDAFRLKSQLFGNIGKDHIDGNACACIAYIVIDHEDHSIRFQDSRAFSNHACYFIEITFYHSGNAIII